jgi:LysR family cys regulon transcriptional activator
MPGSSNLKKRQARSSWHRGHRLRSIAATHSAGALCAAARREGLSRASLTSSHLHQGFPRQVADMLLSGEVDVGIATEALERLPGAGGVAAATRWTHSIIAARPPLLSSCL